MPILGFRIKLLTISKVIRTLKSSNTLLKHEKKGVKKVLAFGSVIRDKLSKATHADFRKKNEDFDDELCNMIMSISDNKSEKEIKALIEEYVRKKHRLIPIEEYDMIIKRHFHAGLIDRYVTPLRLSRWRKWLPADLTKIENYHTTPLYEIFKKMPIKNVIVLGDLICTMQLLLEKHPEFSQTKSSALIEYFKEIIQAASYENEVENIDLAFRAVMLQELGYSHPHNIITTVREAGPVMSVQRAISVLKSDSTFSEDEMYGIKRLMAVTRSMNFYSVKYEYVPSDKNPKADDQDVKRMTRLVLELDESLPEDYIAGKVHNYFSERPINELVKVYKLVFQSLFPNGLYDKQFATQLKAWNTWRPVNEKDKPDYYLQPMYNLLNTLPRHNIIVICDICRILIWLKKYHPDYKQQSYLQFFDDFHSTWLPYVKELKKSEGSKVSDPFDDVLRILTQRGFNYPNIYIRFG